MARSRENLNSIVLGFAAVFAPNYPAGRHLRPYSARFGSSFLDKSYLNKGILGQSMIDTVINVIEQAGIDFLTISVPGNVIQQVSKLLLTKWSCNSSDIIGKQILKTGFGALTAKYLHGDMADKRGDRIEISYAPLQGDPIKSIFRAQTIGSGKTTTLLLVAETTSIEQSPSGLAT